MLGMPEIIYDRDKIENEEGLELRGSPTAIWWERVRSDCAT